MDGKILGEDGPPGNRVRFIIHEYEGNRLLDIRKFYLAKKPNPLTGKREFMPKRQGINLNRDSFMELKRMMEKYDKEILEFLKIGHIPEEMLRYHQAELQAMEKGFRLANDVEITEVNNFRDSHMFHVTHQGGKDIVELNTSHPFAKAISVDEIAKSSPEEIRDLFASILAAY